MDQQQQHQHPSFSPASFNAQAFQSLPVNSFPVNDSQHFNSFQPQQPSQIPTQSIPIQLQNQASFTDSPQNQHSSLSNTAANTPVSMASPSAMNIPPSPLAVNNSQQSSFHRQQSLSNQNNTFNIRTREELQKCALVCFKKKFSRFWF